MWVYVYIIEKGIDVLRSQNIILVELSRAFHLDFKVSVPGVGIYRWSQSILRNGGIHLTPPKIV